MKTLTVEMLHACGNWPAGSIEKLEVTRAQKLIRTGYARVVETADDAAEEVAVKPKSADRTVKPAERRA